MNTDTGACEGSLSFVMGENKNKYNLDWERDAACTFKLSR
jgi:hypothetical protein